MTFRGSFPIGASGVPKVALVEMPRGTIVTVYSGITASVAVAAAVEQSAAGFNALLIECAVSAITTGNWVVEVQGCSITGGTFGSIFTADGATAAAFRKHLTPASGTGFMNATANYTFLFVGLPDYYKIVATRTTDGTLTLKSTPLNI